LDDFRRLTNDGLTLNIPFKTEEDIEAAAKFFHDTIQCAGWNAMQAHGRTLKAYDCSKVVKEKSEEKRRLRRLWHVLRTSASKRLLNAATREFK
jgi:hypothetical protein